MTMATRYLSLAFKSMEAHNGDDFEDEERKSYTGKGKGVEGDQFCLPITLTKVAHCVETLKADVQSCDQLLNDTIQMVYISSFTVNGRYTIICQSERPNFRLDPATIQNISHF
jgi:hypothetical protein